MSLVAACFQHKANDFNRTRLERDSDTGWREFPPIHQFLSSVCSRNQGLSRKRAEELVEAETGVQGRNKAT